MAGGANFHSPTVVVVRSMDAKTGGQSQTVAMTSTSAASAAIGSDNCVVTVDASCFIRQGAAPVALADGTDQYLVANQPYRITAISPTTNKLAFILSTGTGNAFITPSA